jgi:hypothetical protein
MNVRRDVSEVMGAAVNCVGGTSISKMHTVDMWPRRYEPRHTNHMYSAKQKVGEASAHLHRDCNAFPT